MNKRNIYNDLTNKVLDLINDEIYSQKTNNIINKLYTCYISDTVKKIEKIKKEKEKEIQYLLEKNQLISYKDIRILLFTTPLETKLLLESLIKDNKIIKYFSSHKSLLFKRISITDNPHLYGKL